MSKLVRFNPLPSPFSSTAKRDPKKKNNLEQTGRQFGQVISDQIN